ncbi:MAG: hypothetical protein Q8Q01_02630 [archaeon]|nr:hypothetical protein [archaeon]
MKKNSLGIKSDVDYHKVANALDFYEEKGYEKINVPWIISKEAYQITSKGYPQILSRLGYHVASAEQSFLELILKEKLPLGKFVACSPCFRDDKVDNFHNKNFLKVELINHLGFKKPDDGENLVKEMLNDAKEFLQKYASLKIKKTSQGLDLFLEEIEVGSYGIRSHAGFYWVYGTGLAEPRFSYCLKKQKRGYHLKDIAKGKLGEKTKIYEEIEEFKDSLQQNNPLMALLELSDLIGSIEEYLNQQFRGTISLDDLIAMKDVTKRAFINGHRK